MTCHQHRRPLTNGGPTCTYEIHHSWWDEGRWEPVCTRCAERCAGHFWMDVRPLTPDGDEHATPFSNG